MRELWQARRWRYLLSRIDHLPRNSAYVEAVSLDEELAAEVLKQQDKPKAAGVRMRDWSPEMEVLVAAVDRLGEVVQAVIAAQGAKPPKIAPLPRPTTASDKLRDPRKQHQKVLAKVMITQPDGSVISAAEMARRRRSMPALPLR